MNKNLKLETIHPQKGDVILLKFNINEIGLDNVHVWFEELKTQFPNNQLIAMPSNIEISLEDRQKLIEYLNKYDNKESI